MTRKRDVQRSYPPEYVSADTAAYLLDCSRSTLDDYLRRGLLPKPLEVGTMPRWRWRDLDSFILSRNGLAPGTPGEAPSEPDRYSKGVLRVASPHA
jgi:predicted DNA-binding transcriptional regulator AlpA